MKQQRIDKRAVRMARRRMYNHALRLIHNDDVRILIYNIERNLLRLGFARLRRRHRNFIYRRSIRFFIFGNRRAVFGDISLRNQALHRAARKPALFSQCRIEAQPRRKARNFHFSASFSVGISPSALFFFSSLTQKSGSFAFASKNKR